MSDDDTDQITEQNTRNWNDYMKLLVFVRQIAYMEYVDAPILTAQKILLEIGKGKTFKPKRFA